MTGSGGGQLVKPVLDERVGIEYSVHRPSPAFLRELCLVFPGVDMATILVIPTMQRASGDLVADSPDAAEEKDRLLEVFCEWATRVCDYIKEHGAWADFTDPCSGFPMLGERGPAPYPDVSGAQQLLRYEVINGGCCPLVSHPKWRTKCYPATVFTTADVDVFLRAVEHAASAGKGPGP